MWFICPSFYQTSECGVRLHLDHSSLVVNAVMTMSNSVTGKRGGAPPTDSTLTATSQENTQSSFQPLRHRHGCVCVCVSLNSNFSLNLLHYHELKWRHQKTQKLLVNVITNSLSCPYSVAFVSHYKSQTCVCSCSHDMTRVTCVLFFILTLHQNRTRPCAALSPCE